MNQAYCPYCMTPVKPGEPCPSCGLTEGSYHSQPHHLPPGTVLADRYLLGRVLGEGGFGITYIGCDTRLELRVAVKEYYPGNHVTRNSAVSPAVTCFDGVAGRGFEKGRERFIREARTMARMDKTPQIVAVRDFFQENDTAYIVMEYVDGTTFKELVAQRGGRLSAGELLPMLQPLFGALSSMHSQGLIHRDISPDNLMLENGMVRLLDFGCARESEKGNETMTIVLKQGYSPVEQYQHKGQGAWTDVYSLAATMYYCLTGKTPPQALDRICDDELIPPRKLGADLTREQELALLYGMGLQPTRRFRSVQEFYAALYQGVPVPLVPVPPETREEEIEPENDTEAPRENVTEMPQESDTETPRSREPEAAPAEEPKQPVRTAAQETETERPSDAPEASQSGKTDEAAEKTAVRPNRKKRFLIGGAAAAAALVLALVLIIPRLTGPAGPDGPSAEGSENPAASVEPLPENLFDGAARAANARELLALLSDDSVSAILLVGSVDVLFAEPVTISKPVRLESGTGLNFAGPVTVSSTVQVAEGGYFSSNHDFTLTESGALYVGQGSTAEISRKGGNAEIAGTIQVSRDGGAGFFGKTAVSGAVLSESGVAFQSDTEIAGTVRIAESGDVWFGGFTTVSGPGLLEVNGAGNADHVLKTLDGGSVTVGDTGWMSFNVLWLEKAADLHAASDHINMDQSRYVVADEDGPFENAAHVNSFRELEQAVNDRLVTAIVIDSGFELDYNLWIGKPVLISEGAELNFDDRGMLTFNDMTVNYGSVTGHMQLDGQSIYLNYGGTDADIFANNGNNCLLNMGELNLRYGQYIGGAIINLDRMRHETYGNEDENYLDLAACTENLGELTVASGNRLWTGNGGYFENRGELIIEKNARLENSTHMNSSGVLRIRGAFDNTGGILDISNPDVLSMDGGRVEGGIIVTGPAGSLLASDENITGEVLTLREEPTDFVEVSNADEFMAALDAGEAGAIRVIGDITVDASLSLKKSLIIDGGARLRAADLTVPSGHMLCIRGELEADELTVDYGGQLQLQDGGRIDTGALKLENNSTGVIWGDLTAGSVLLSSAGMINWGNMLQCGGLALAADSSYSSFSNLSSFYNRGYLELAENAAINVNGGVFTDVSWLEMPSGSITIDNGGTMLLCSGAHLYDGVTVTNRGVFNVANCEFWLDGGASIVNYGHLGFYHWDWQNVAFGGEVTNRGYLHLDGPERVDGVLNNYGNLEIGYGVLQIGGQLNNNGAAYTYNREAGFRGNWTGRALEYR